MPNETAACKKIEDALKEWLKNQEHINDLSRDVFVEAVEKVWDYHADKVFPYYYQIEINGDGDIGFQNYVTYRKGTSLFILQAHFKDHNEMLKEFRKVLKQLIKKIHGKEHVVPDIKNFLKEVLIDPEPNKIINKTFGNQEANVMWGSDKGIDDWVGQTYPDACDFYEVINSIDDEDLND